jgi:uncharacterized protein
MENTLETRYSNEIRANAESGVIEGTAIVFNSESEPLANGQFTEKIMPQAATQEFLMKQDIVMKFNHEPNSILARYRPNAERNSLHFNVDARGVNFSFKTKAKDAGILESIQSGDLSSASFSFRVSDEPNSERWEKRDNGTYLRTVNKFDAVKDFSIVIDPAYQKTQVNTRGLEEIKQAEELQKQNDKEERENAVKAQQEKEKNIVDYYKKFDDIINKLKK